MPVIRVDDEVFKELQRRAEPLVDNPNSVMRRILNLNEESKQGELKCVEIELKSINTPQRWALIPVPRNVRRFFPGYKVAFFLETDVGTITTKITSAPKGTPESDPNAGSYMQGSLRAWFDNHRDLKAGAKLRFNAIKPGKRYRLSLVEK